MLCLEGCGVAVLGGGVRVSAQGVGGYSFRLLIFRRFSVVLMFHFGVWESPPSLIFCCLLGELVLMSCVGG